MSGSAHGEGSFVDHVHEWTMHHFSITDTDTSQLLRKVADAIDELGRADVFDMTFKQEVDGPETMTVYFAFPDMPE